MGRLQRIRAAFSSQPPERDSWASGDMAETIADGGRWIAETGDIVTEPHRGQTLIVRVVYITRGIDGVYRPYLGFARWPHRLFDARGFRKLTPRAGAAIAADAAFLRRLRRNQTPAPSLHQRLAARLQRILS